MGKCITGMGLSSESIRARYAQHNPGMNESNTSSSDEDGGVTAKKDAKVVENSGRIIKESSRVGIVEQSVRILRNHGKSDEEIKTMMLKDFLISEEKLDEILNAGQNDSNR